METPAFLNKKIICSILDKFKKEEANLKIISFSGLYKRLDEHENRLVKSFLKLNPGNHGFKGKFLGIEAIPKNLISIDGQFLPSPAYKAFLRMNSALEAEIGKKLIIFSGYRSPAYQVIVFMWCLKKFDFDFFKTVKTVAFPGFSEHGNIKNQGIDFCTNVIRSPRTDPKGFEKTIEYDWLTRNGDIFGFSLSYPENNGDGIIFEPWHWRFSCGQ